MIHRGYQTSLFILLQSQEADGGLRDIDKGHICYRKHMEGHKRVLKTY